MDAESFFAVHRDLPREGPGLPEDVHWALAQLDTTPARVLDTACGPGADAETLARALPEARIDAVDKVDHFVDAANARLAPFGDRASVWRDDMLSVPGPYDLIWCAGAVYFVGIRVALTAWRRALAPGGSVAFSEPMMPKDASPAVRKFWDDEGGAKDEATILSEVAGAGYRVRATRPIIGDGWEAYYTPMEARIAHLRANDPSPGVIFACDDAEAEIAKWRAARDEVAYLLVVADPLPG
ncbi:MAG: trans-aconitate 2-methyltransferase [Paracoccaceae bacterium]